MCFSVLATPGGLRDNIVMSARWSLSGAAFSAPPRHATSLRTVLNSLTWLSCLLIADPYVPRCVCSIALDYIMTVCSTNYCASVPASHIHFSADTLWCFTHDTNMRYKIKRYVSKLLTCCLPVESSSQLQLKVNERVGVDVQIGLDKSKNIMFQ